MSINPNMHPVILIYDMNSFFASVELRERPDLVGKPVIIGTIRRRKVVSTATPQARQFGVEKGMATLEAARLCPNAIWLPPRILAYEEESDEILKVVKAEMTSLGFDPAIHTVGLDEAYVDLTPYCQGKNADESLNNAKPIADRIKSAILQKRKLHCKIGIASSMMVAKIASDLKSPDGINVVHDADLATLLPPLGVNEIPGVGDANERKLKAAGYNTIADIQREPAGFDFTPIVGNSLGSILRDFAYGKDRRPVVPDEPNKSFGREDTFEFDTNDIKKIMPVIIGFAKELEARLRAFNRVAWLVKITYAYEFNKKKSQQKTLGAPVSDFGLITANGASILTGGDILSRPLYLVGISVGSLSAPGEMPPTKKKLVQRHRDEMVLFDVKGLK